MSAFPTIVTRVQNGVVFTQEIADGKILWESQALECGPIPTDPDQTVDFNLFHKAQSTALADAYSPAIKAMLGAKESASP